MAPAADLDARLHLIATKLVWGSGAWVDEAIDTACALVVSDRETPATLDVCSLPPGTTLAVAQPLLLAMLAEQGLPVPPVDPSDGERYAYLVRAFGLGVIGLADFSGEFYSHLPAWDDQSLMEQRVVVLLDAWEHEQDEERRTAVVTDMRAAVRGKRG